MNAPTQEQRERWATLYYGEPCEFNKCRYGEGPIAKHWHNTVFGLKGWGIADEHLPNFAALNGRFFGYAAEELIDADWVPAKYVITVKGSYYEWAHRQIVGMRVQDRDLGICTMLALEMKRAADRRTTLRATTIEEDAR